MSKPEILNSRSTLLEPPNAEFHFSIIISNLHKDVVSPYHLRLIKQRPSYLLALE